MVLRTRLVEVDTEGAAVTHAVHSATLRDAEATDDAADEALADAKDALEATELRDSRADATEAEADDMDARADVAEAVTALCEAEEADARALLAEAMAEDAEADAWLRLETTLLTDADALETDSDALDLQLEVAEGPVGGGVVLKGAMLVVASE